MRSRKVRLLATLVLLALGVGAVTATAFAQLTPEPVWSAGARSEDTRGLVWEDFDVDGDLDLVAGIYKDTNSWLCLNEGGGTMVRHPFDDGSNETTHVAAADFDGDGDPDLATATLTEWWTAGHCAVYLNAGGEFQLHWEISTPCFQVGWADWDGDGDPDLTLALRQDTFGSYVRIFRNDDGRFVPDWRVPHPETYAFAWGDYDGDGDPDLADSGSGGIYRNHGGGPMALAWSGLVGCRRMAWADHDGDGDLDLACASGSSYDGLYENLGNDQFERVWDSPYEEMTRDIAWGDWDGDGDPDLAMAVELEAPLGVVRVFQNDDGTLNEAWTHETWAEPLSVAWGDWDGDSALELAVGFRTWTQVIYGNLGPGTCDISTLGEPHPLKARKVGGDSIEFLWPSDPVASEYHLNGVSDKADLQRAHRPPRGVASAPCSRALSPSGWRSPIHVCLASGELSTPEPRGFYRSVLACGPTGDAEGPL